MIRYKTIVIDPPWPIEPMILKKYSLSVPYQTMSLDEISELPINLLADDDCALFLWTTHRFLPDAFPLINKWGFRYYACLTWDKISGLTHQGVFRRTEFVLYAYKGKMNIKETGQAIPALFREAKGRHSQKPQVFDNIIRRNTQMPRLDMFARVKKLGFDSYGDDKKLEELQGQIALEKFT